MKTIAQIAAEIGVSKQAVSDKIAKLGLQSALQKNGNRFAISPSDEILIKSAFAHGEHEKNDKQNNKNNDKRSPSIDTLISMLQKELEVKDKQINDLSNRLAEVTGALLAAQQTAQAAQALHAGTMKQIAPEQQDHEGKQEIIITAAQAGKKEGFISRILGSRRT